MSPYLPCFTECGAGCPLVLLHGNGESSAYFENQISYFSAKYRVIAVDTRGHGRSPRGDAPFTLEQFAEDLGALFDALKIKKALLLGFSDGAGIALIFALKHPEYIEKLVLNGANLSPSGVKFTTQLPIVTGYLAASLISIFDKRATAKKELLGLMVREPHIAPRSLAMLKMPILVIVGTDDMIKDAHSALIAASLPNGRLTRLEGGHFIAAENSNAFNRAVGDFLAE